MVVQEKLLIPDYTIDIVKEILKQKDTFCQYNNKMELLTNRFDEIIKLDKDLRKKLNISFFSFII